MQGNEKKIGKKTQNEDFESTGGRCTYVDSNAFNLKITHDSPYITCIYMFFSNYFFMIFHPTLN